MRKNKGFSFMEAILATAILLLIILAVAPFFRGATQSFERDALSNKMKQEAQMAMDKITEELKYTNEIIEIDASYINFGTSGEEYYLDDKNAGFSTSGTWTEGTLQGGFASDYQRGAAGDGARYNFRTITEGWYDVYVWHVATSDNSSSVTYTLYDDGAVNVGTSQLASYNQQSNGARWNKILTDADLSTDVNDYLLASSPIVANFVADGVKLVYKGYRQKVFSYNSTNRSMHFKQNRTGAGAGSSVADAQTNLLIGPLSSTNTEKLPTIYPSGGTGAIFSYYEMDGTTATTSTMNTALIRISFEVRDPDNRVPPYKMTGQVRRVVSPAWRRLVINEINYKSSAASKVIFDDNMDGYATINDTSYSGVYPDYSTYNNWYDNFEGSTTAWTKSAATNIYWQRLQCDSISDDVFDVSARYTWLTGRTASSCTSNPNINTNERLMSANITLPTFTTLGDLRWNEYNSKWVANTTVQWQICNATDNDCSLDAPWATLLGFSDAGADERKWSRRTEADSYIPLAYSGKIVKLGYRIVTTSPINRPGIRYENPSIFPNPSSATVGMTNNTVKYTDTSIGHKTLWRRGTPDTSKTSAAPITSHPTCYGGSGRCWGTSSGVNSTTNPTDSYNYPETIDGSFETPDGSTYKIDLTSATCPTLEFYQWRDVVTTNNTVNTDGGIVEVSIDGGTSWTQLTNATHSLSPDYYAVALAGTLNPLNNGTRRAYSDDLTTWTKTTASLSNFQGQTIRVRFRFGSDNSGGTIGGNTFTDGHSAGWYIDNIKVYNQEYEWIEIYNPTPFAIQVTSNNAGCNETSLGSCDLTEAWRIYTNTHPGSGDTYDNIIPYSGDGRYQIPPYGYAIIANDSAIYTSSCSNYKSIIDANNPVRLLIDDGYFGATALTDDFGQVYLRDNNGKLVDYVGYNLAFYDTFENSSLAGLWSVESSGGATSWSRGNLAAGDNLANNNDNTTGASTGYVYGTNLGGNYANSSTAYLYTPSIDVSLASLSTLSFYHRYRIAAGDSAVVQRSVDGGSSWSDLGASFGVGTQTSWTQSTRAPPANSFIMLRFKLESDAATVETGWYIDDVVVYWTWGAKGNGKTLEKINWVGSSDSKSNWSESSGNYGTPGDKNSVTP